MTMRSKTTGTLGPELWTTTGGGLESLIGESPRIENKGLSFLNHLTSYAASIYDLQSGAKVSSFGIRGMQGGGTREVEQVLLGNARLETAAAARFIHAGGSHHAQIAG